MARAALFLIPAQERGNEKTLQDSEKKFLQIIDGNTTPIFVIFISRLPFSEF